MGFAIRLGPDGFMSEMYSVDPVTHTLTRMPIIGTTENLGGLGTSKAERLRIAREALASELTRKDRYRST
jgi:hypothetical protein